MRRLRPPETLALSVHERHACETRAGDHSEEAGAFTTMSSEHPRPLDVARFGPPPRYITSRSIGVSTTSNIPTFVRKTWAHCNMLPTDLLVCCDLRSPQAAMRTACRAHLHRASGHRQLRVLCDDLEASADTA